MTTVQEFSVHVRFDGRSYEFTSSQLDIGDLSTDAQIKSAIASELNIQEEALLGYEVDRHANNNVTLHPQATFGLAEMEVVHKSVLHGKSKTQIKEWLWEEYMARNPGIARETWQDRPWTAVKLTIFPPILAEARHFYGFSKLCHPDTWSDERGVELAVQKAIAKVAKRFGE